MVMNDDLAKVKSATNHDDMEPKTCYEGTRPEYVAQTFFLVYITIATIIGNSAICCSIYYKLFIASQTISSCLLLYQT